jgi:signal transduction histidine kinase
VLGQAVTLSAALVIAHHRAAQERARAEAALGQDEDHHGLLLRLSDTLRPLADPAAIPEAASRLLGEHFGALRAAYLESGDFLAIVIERDWVRPGIPSLAGRYPVETFGQAIADSFRSGVPTVIEDTQTDPRLNPAARAAYQAMGVRSGMGRGLMKDGLVVSAIFILHDQPRRYTQAEIQLLSEVGERTWAAIQRARAEAALAAASERAAIAQAVADERRTLLKRVVDAQEAERLYLARELHDEIGQALTGLQLQLAALARGTGHAAAKEAQQIVRELTSRVGALSVDLRPAVLDSFGLLPALRSHAQQYETRTGLEIDLRHAGLDRRFSTEVEITAYRLVQEGLTNVVRHSGARRALVQLFADHDTLTVAVRDTGDGFDQPTTPDGGGLSGMRERLELVGGSMTVESVPGEGTFITAELPIGEGGR